MMLRDPTNRLDAAAVLQRWRQLRGGVSLLHRGRRLRPRDEGALKAAALGIVSSIRLAFLLCGRAIRRTTRSATALIHR